MAVRIVLGPAGSGKTATAISKLREYKPLSWCNEVNFIVPTSEQTQHISNKILQDDSIPGLLGDPIRTFFGFASDVITGAGLRARLISDTQKRLMLSDLLESVSLDYFHNASESPGFVDALDQIIGELKVSMVEPQELEAALVAAKPQMSPQSTRKISELLRIYRAYQDEILLKEQIHDREGLMWRALQILRDRQLLKNYKSFILDGFSEFTGVQKEFLRLISEQVEDVLVTLPYEPERKSVFECVEPTLEFLKSLGDVEVSILARPVGAESSLQVIERSVFSRQVQPISCDQKLVVLRGGGQRLESEMIADEILSLARAGVSCGNIGVVVRDMDTYYDYITGELSKRGIPFKQHDLPLKQSAVARTVAASLEAVTNGWEREHVIGVLKSPFLSSDFVQVCKIEIAARQRGITGGKDSWFESWGTDDDTQDCRINSLAPLSTLDDDISAANSATSFASAVRGFVKCFKTRDENRRFTDDAAIRQMETLLDELERTEELIGRTLHKGHLHQLFINGIHDATYRTPESRDHGVSIVRAESIGGRKFDVVFVAGLLEKVFPRQVKEDSFLRDSERQLLNKSLSAGLDERLPDQARERFLFYSAVTSATERLYLSYPSADASAKDSMPSFYIDEVTKLFEPGSVKIITRDVGDIVQPPSQAETQNPMLDGLVYGLSSGVFDQDFLINLYNSVNDRSIISRCIEFADDINAEISSNRILEHISTRRKRFRVTELEDFAACPYKYFCNRTLGLETIEDEVGALNRGIILHDVLCKLFREVMADKPELKSLKALDAAQLTSKAAELLDDAVSRDAMLMNTPDYIRRMEQRRLEKILGLYLNSEIKNAPDNYVPKHFELEFGNRAVEGRERDPGSVDAPMVIRNDEMYVEICGKIDRVDVNIETGEAIAIDYKLNKAPKQSDIDNGLKLQAPLYALALGQLFDLEPTGSQYRGLTKLDSSGPVAISVDLPVRNKLTVQDLQIILNTSISRVLEIADKIASSEISPAPVKGACTFCNLGSICRIDPWKMIQTEESSDEQN